jgi:hypothetical protein
MFKLGIFIDGAFLPSYEGGTQRFKGLTEWMQFSGIDVTVFHCYRGWSSIDIIANQEYRTYFIPPERYHNDLNLIIELIKKHELDIIVMTDYESVLKFGVPVKLALPNVCLCFEVVDIFSDYQKSFSHSEGLVAKTLEEEQAAFSVADLCVCFSTRDSITVRRSLIQSGISAEKAESRIVRLPFGIHGRIDTYIGSNVEAKTVLFLGNFYHVPNARALELIATAIYPTVTLIDPQVVFLLVGDVAPGLCTRFARHNFVFTGKVENLATVFRKASLAIAPIFQGSGIKVKVLDYSLYGMPVICTSESLHGIAASDTQNAFVVENILSNYSKHIVELLQSPRKLDGYSRLVHKAAITQLWPSIISETISAYANCIRQGAKPPNAKVLEHIDYYRTLTPYHLVDHIGQNRFAAELRAPLNTVLLGSKGLLENILL